MTLRKIFILTFCLFLVACKEPAAQTDADSGLYDPVAPAGSAFVRFINLQEGNLAAQIAGKTYPSVSNTHSSPYYVVQKGKHAVTLNGVAQKQDFEPESFYSIVVSKNAPLFLKDQPNKDRSKATIAFYNMTEQAGMTLKVREGSVAVLEQIGAFSSNARDMNAAKVDFSVHQGDEIRQSLPPQIIERGNHYSVIYTGDQILWIMAETNTRL